MKKYDKLPIDVRDGISTLKQGLDQMYFTISGALEFLPLEDSTEQARNILEAALDTYEVAKMRAATKLGEETYKIGLAKKQTTGE